MIREAVLLYKHLSKLEYEFGNISLYTFRLRLITLYNLSDNLHELKEEIYYYLGEIDLLQIPYEEEETTSYTLDASESEYEESLLSNLNPKDENVTYFLTSKPGKISKWQFRVGDPDFYPSIPHGHSTINSKIKLDSYLGYIYDVSNEKTKAKESDRESRQYIIDLWNDSNFRQLAIKCIDWYLDTYPSYKWRVPVDQIRVLPKKR